MSYAKFRPEKLKNTKYVATLSDLNFADESGILQEFNTWNVLLLFTLKPKLLRIWAKLLLLFDKFLTTNVGKKHSAV